MGRVQGRSGLSPKPDLVGLGSRNAKQTERMSGQTAELV
jgi:hypothetical protein